mmetsp:Transcript_35986/g.70810  ORF Transcript_35986/g.70810 Transcript_35986/m.70810 type:complete len:156 (+) Transcript_35986:156-623(+)
MSSRAKRDFLALNIRQSLNRNKEKLKDKTSERPPSPVKIKNMRTRSASIGRTRSASLEQLASAKSLRENQSMTAATPSQVPLKALDGNGNLRRGPSPGLLTPCQEGKQYDNGSGNGNGNSDASRTCCPCSSGIGDYDTLMGFLDNVYDRGLITCR